MQFANEIWLWQLHLILFYHWMICIGCPSYERETFQDEVIKMDWAESSENWCVTWERFDYLDFKNLIVLFSPQIILVEENSDCACVHYQIPIMTFSFFFSEKSMQRALTCTHTHEAVDQIMKYPYLSLCFQASYFWLHIKNIVRHIRLFTLILSNIIILAKIQKISFFFCFLFQTVMMLMQRS